MLIDDVIKATACNVRVSHRTRAENPQPELLQALDSEMEFLLSLWCHLMQQQPTENVGIQPKLDHDSSELYMDR